MYYFIESIKNLFYLINFDENSQNKIKWIGNAFMYVSAIAISVSIDMSIEPITYLGFFIAHIIWLFIAWKVRDWPLLWQFAFFVPFDIYAMYIRL